MTQVKTGRRQRGGTQPSPLSNDDVMRAALAIVERSSLDDLTIKALADELGVTSPAVYHYVDGKDALVVRVCEQVTGRVDLGVDPGAPWQDRIVTIMLRLHDAFARYPGVGARSLALRGPAPASDRISTTIRSIVLDAGFDDGTARELGAALHLVFSGWLVGKVPVTSPTTEMTPELLERITHRLLRGYREPPAD
jgi:AcrR family transcriptional regulator